MTNKDIAVAEALGYIVVTDEEGSELIQYPSRLSAHTRDEIAADFSTSLRPYITAPTPDTGNECLEWLVANGHTFVVRFDYNLGVKLTFANSVSFLPVEADTWHKAAALAVLEVSNG